MRRRLVRLVKIKENEFSKLKNYGFNEASKAMAHSDCQKLGFGPILRRLVKILTRRPASRTCSAREKPGRGSTGVASGLEANAAVENLQIQSVPPPPSCLPPTRGPLRDLTMRTSFATQGQDLANFKRAQIRSHLARMAEVRRLNGALSSMAATFG